MNGIEKAVNVLIALGIGVFIINLILALNYSGYAQTRNQLVTQYGSTSGVVTNYTTNGGGTTNTYGNNVNLAIFALIFIAIIVAVLIGIKSGKVGGGEGGFLQ